MMGRLKKLLLCRLKIKKKLFDIMAFITYTKGTQTLRAVTVALKALSPPYSGLRMSLREFEKSQKTMNLDKSLSKVSYAQGFGYLNGCCGGIGRR